MIKSTSSLLKLICLLCVTSLLSFSGIPSALTETYEGDSTLQSSQTSLSFTLPDFNTSLGTLDGIDVTFSLIDSPTITVYNITANSLTFSNAAITSSATVTGPGNLNFQSSMTTHLSSGTASPGLNNYSGMSATMTQSELVAAGDFGQFETQPDGTVTFVLAQGPNSYMGTGPSGQLFFGGGSSIEAKSTIQYTYLAAPEPGSKYLAGMVAAALALLVLRRRASGI